MSGPGAQRRAISAIACGAALMAGLAVAGCGSDESTQVTVPVLWAADQGNGKVQGGVEPAVVKVADSEDNPGFAVNLTDVKSKGAGEAWTAASSSAAAVGTLASARSPRDISIAFDITGAIDGPSGGAGLTVGVIAAARKVKLLDKVTITGTINPDGTVGVVSYIATKMRAAARDGYETIVIPSLVTNEYDPATGKRVNLRKLGRSLGLRVVPVELIGQAYSTMTGERLFPVDPEARASLRPQVQAVTSRQARSAVGRLDTELARTPSAPASLDGQAQLARRELAAGNYPGAYGVAVDTLQGAWRSQTRALTTGEQAAQARRLATKAEELLASGQRASQLNPEQQVTLPSALGPAVLGSSLLAGIGADRDADADSLAAARVAIDLTSPDAVQAVRAYGRQPVSGDVARFLSGYTNFLIRAGDANLTYFEKVGASAAAGETYLPAAQALKEVVDKTPPGENAVDQEIVQSARAFTYFLLTASLVAAVPSSERQVAEVKDRDRETLAAAVAAGRLIAPLQSKGLDGGYPVWASRWGAGAVQALPGTSEGADGAAQGYQQTTYSLITSLLLTAAAREAEQASGS